MYRLRLVPFFLCFALLVARAWPRLLNAHLWAEDGVVFLGAVLNHGRRSVFFPYGGYYHLIPRWVAWLCSLLPLQYYACLTSLFCFAVYAAVFSEFSAPSYSWIVARRSIRSAACLLMCMSPGLQESLGNLANIHTGCLIFLALFALRELSAPIKAVSLIWVVLSAWTEGSAFLFIPSYVLRTVETYKHRRAYASRLYLRNLAIVAVLFVSFISNLRASGLTSTQTAASMAWPLSGQFFRDAIWLVFDRFVLVPLLWTELDFCVQWRNPHLFWCLCIPILLWIVFNLATKPQNLRWLLFLSALSIVVHYLLMWVMRPGTEPLFSMLEVIGSVRHSLASAPLGIVLWCAALQNQCKTTHFPLFVYFWLSFTLTGQKFSIGHMKNAERNWPDVAKKLEEARRYGTTTPVFVPVSPKGFEFYYAGKK